LKQEQFAIQLIYEFDYIFKLEKLPLILTPYEVISMGPDCGIIEIVKETVTIDGLKKKLKGIDSMKSATLKEFF
jgi:phosphatidylinositol 4-kinase B